MARRAGAAEKPSAERKLKHPAVKRSSESEPCIHSAFSSRRLNSEVASAEARALIAATQGSCSQFCGFSEHELDKLAEVHASEE